MFQCKGDHYRYEYDSAGELDKVTLPDGKGLKRNAMEDGSTSTRMARSMVPPLLNTKC